MKKLMTIFLLTGCIIGNITAQETPSLRFHEFGISFYNLNSFGLRYKYGTEKTRLRITLLALNLASSSQSGRQDSIDQKNRGYGAGFRIGFDHSITLAGTFSLILGGELGLNYNYSYWNTRNPGYSPDEYTQWSISPGISFIFGINYVLKDHFVLGAEINPTLSYTYGISKYKQPQEYQVTANNLVFNLVTSGAGLYIAYRFGK